MHKTRNRKKNNPIINKLTKERGFKNGKNIHIEISNILKELGVLTNLKGYKFLRTAIELAIEDFNILDAITKELYPAIAKVYNTTSARVERAIRHAIETSINIGDMDAWHKYFKGMISYNSGKVTNSTFIATIADYVLLNN